MEISVIIPVYNNSIWLEKLWNSIKNQSIYNKLEIVFINDGSTDDSLEVIKSLTKDEKNVRIITQENGGVSKARNAGIDASTSKYITFIDADDYIDRMYFEVLLKSANDGDMIITGFVNEYEGTSVIKKPRYNEVVNENLNIIKDFLLGKIEPNSTNKLFKREIIGELRFNEKYSIAEDKLFIYQYLTKVEKVVFISEALYHYNHTNETAATKASFNNNKMHSLQVSQMICDDVKNNYNNLIEYALSSDIDVKCRVYCDINKYKKEKDFIVEYKKLKKDIMKYSLFKKLRYSNKKHTLALVLAKIHPKLYILVKEKMKFQFK